jgi:hypothetical protein
MICRTWFIKALYFFFLVFGISLSFSFQKAPDVSVIDVDHYTGRKVVVGTEGGIVAMRNETVILRSGEVYYHNNVVNEYKYLKKLSKKQVRRVFHLAANPGLPHKKFEHPGNMSTFLQEFKNQRLIKNFVWGEPGVDVPPTLDKVYSEIINIIK